MITPEIPDDEDGDRTVFWPDSLVPTVDGRAAVFYQRVLLDGPEWTVQATIVDEMDPGATTFDRTDEMVLFGEGEPSFVSSNLVDGGFIYLYATRLHADQRTTEYLLARVPHALYRQRVAYTFWSGTSWSPNLAAAQPVVLGGGNDTDRSGGLGGMSVSFNPYLGKYLMTHSEAFGPDLVLRSAPAPHGPWSEPTYLDVTDPVKGTQFGNYTAREHPEFRSGDGSVVWLTYHRVTGWLHGEIPLVRVVLNPP